MSRNLLSAAVAAFVILSAGCEDDPSGNIGGGFIEEDANLQTRSVSVGAVEEVSANGFQGRHRFMAIGRYDDSLFGEFTSTGILKPSIDTTRTGSLISEEDTFQLRLVFSSTVYGDTTSTAHFEIYRLADVWRGVEVRFGDEIPLDESQRVGEFSVTENETVIVDLDRSWVEEYNEFLSNEDANRNQRYRDEFPGLAIVPAPDNAKVLFARMRPAGNEEDDDLQFVRFVVDSDNGDNGNGNGEDENGEDENGEDDETGNGEENDNGEEVPGIFQTLRDWGALASRPGSGVENEETYPVHNTLERLIRLDPGLDEQTLGSKNLANVRLILYPDRDLLDASIPEGHVRPPVERLNIHIIDSENIVETIFNRAPQFTADLDSDEQRYIFDITDFANDVVFESQPPGKFHITVQTVNGLLFSSSIFNENAPEELRPRISITSVKSGSE